jgi:hypothetical protein
LRRCACCCIFEHLSFLFPEEANMQLIFTILKDNIGKGENKSKLCSKLTL